TDRTGQAKRQPEGQQVTRVRGLRNLPVWARLSAPVWAAVCHMADTRSRGGKKQGQNNPAAPEQNRTTHVNQPPGESSRPSDQGFKPSDQPRKDDQSMARSRATSRRRGTCKCNAASGGGR